MALSKKDRKQILRNYPGRSIKELAGELGASQKEVRQVLESAGIEIREDKQKLLFSGFARVQPFAIAIIVTAVSLVYLNSIRNGFHYDDIHSLLENLEVRVEWEKNPESRDLFLRYFWHPEYFSSRPNVAMPRPLLMCTFAFNYLIGKYEPLGWVLVNIFLHMMNSVIIYIGITHLTGKTRIALLTALLFAIHPVNTETVNYINCRSESLTTLFMLLTMYFFSRSLREDRLDLRIACFLVFAMGLLTKELAIVLPATLFAIDFLFIWPLNKDRISIERRLLGWYLPVAAVWLAYMGYREILLGHTVVEKAVRPVMENFLTQTRVLVRYIRIMFLPLHLNISYENMDLLWVAYEFKKDPLIGGGVFPSIALLATLVGLMAAWCRKHPVIKRSPHVPSLAGGVHTPGRPVRPDGLIHEGRFERARPLAASGAGPCGGVARPVRPPDHTQEFQLPHGPDSLARQHQEVARKGPGGLGPGQRILPGRQKVDQPRRVRKRREDRRGGEGGDIPGVP